MPSKISTVLEKVTEIPNEANRKMVYEFYNFMLENDTSQNYQRGNLIVIIAFAKSLDGLSLTRVRTSEQVISFLDSRKKDLVACSYKIWDLAHLDNMM